MITTTTIILIGVILAISSYSLLVSQAIRVKREWRRTFNRENPYVKNPYLITPALLFPIIILMVFSLISYWEYSITTLESEKVICIDSLQEWDELRGFVTITYHYAFINNQYSVLFERPHQYGIGDCFILYKYKVGDWRLDKIG